MNLTLIFLDHYPSAEIWPSILKAERLSPTRRSDVLRLPQRLRGRSPSYRVSRRQNRRSACQRTVNVLSQPESGSGAPLSVAVSGNQREMTGTFARQVKLHTKPQRLVIIVLPGCISIEALSQARGQLTDLAHTASFL
jgi:hypothetical protein